MFHTLFKPTPKTVHVILFLLFLVFGCSEDSDIKEEITISAEDLSLTIDENPQNGSIIGRINGVTNRGQITYAIVNQSPEGAIAINSNSGEISVANSSLFEFDDRTMIEALALLSNGNIQREVNVTINLVEVLEQITVSLDNLEITIDENPTVNEVIGTISGTTNRGQIAYSISSQNPEGALSIDSNTGEISVANTSFFDFEIYPTLTATVQGQNEEVIADATVQINLLDVNESISFSKIDTTGSLFSGRTGMETLVFNNTIILFGGFDGGIKRDVWSTNNLTSWSLSGSFGTSNTNGFEVRGTSFQGKLWLTSGGSGLTVPSEVWSSNDGEIWNQEVIAGEFFSGRSRHQLIVFKDKIWVIGGTVQDLDDNVWSSTDGINWNQETTAGADFTRLQYHQVVVFQNKLYVIGGRKGSEPNNDIWSSMDGINWTKETPSNTIFEARSLHQIVIYNDKMWLIGGFGENYLNDVWTTTDGINWNEEVIEGEWFSPRNHHQCVVFEEKLYLIGGRDASSRLNDIWVLDE